MQRNISIEGYDDKFYYYFISFRLTRAFAVRETQRRLNGNFQFDDFNGAVVLLVEVKIDGSN